MKINKNYIVYDLETTGTDTQKDEVVSFYAVLINFNTGKVIKELQFLCKPSFPIPKEASDIHGITNEMVKDKHHFNDHAKSVYDMFKNNIIIGFNSVRYDNVILDRQLQKSGFGDTFDNCIFYDSYVQFTKDNPRKLSDAYKFYTGKNLENAHDAKADVLATAEIVHKQFKNLNKDISEIIQENQSWLPENRVGVTDHIIIENGEPVLNFSKKYKGTPLKKVDKGFLKWVLTKDFPQAVKNTIKKFI